jgi:ubiquitin-small subunit ribosomal protein S27Ae
LWSVSRSEAFIKVSIACAESTLNTAQKVGRPEMSKPQAQQAPQAKKKKKPRMRSELYEISSTTAKLKNRKCPRCGAVMASHSKPVQRWVCGSCSFTDYGSRS